MSDNGASRRWRSFINTHTLGVALTVSLAFLAYLMFRPDVRAVVFTPMSQTAHAEAGAAMTMPTDAAIAHQGQLSSADIPSSTQITSTRPVSTTSPASGASMAMSMTMTMQPAPEVVAENSSSGDPAALIGQLAEMQRALQGASDQLGLRDASGASLPVSSVSGEAAAVGSRQSGTQASGAEVSALMTQIAQLYQVMQPLMERLQNSPPASRSAGELAAMRTQMDDIHRRLAALMQRVQAAKAAANGASTVDVSPTPIPSVMSAAAPVELGDQAKTDQAEIDQMQQTMAQLQILLQQMQSGTTPNGR